MVPVVVVSCTTPSGEILSNSAKDLKSIPTFRYFHWCGILDDVTCFNWELVQHITCVNTYTMCQHIYVPCANIYTMCQHIYHIVLYPILNDLCPFATPHGKLSTTKRLRANDYRFYNCVCMCLGSTHRATMARSPACPTTCARMERSSRTAQESSI